MTISNYEIPGWINDAQCDQITKLVSILPENVRILEVGSAFGKSTLSILAGMKPSQTLDVCDKWDAQFFWDVMNDTEQVDSLYGEKAYKLDVRDKILSNELTIRQIWEKHVSTSANFNLINNIFQQESMTLNSDNYDIVFLDGDHTYENVSKELMKFNGVPIICGDDFGYHCPGVIQAVIEYSNRNLRILTVDLNSYFYVLRRSDFNDCLQ